MPKLDTHYEISLKTILLAFGFFVSLWLLAQIKEVLFAIFVSLIFSLALDPTVRWVQKRRVPRPVAVFAVFLSLITAIASLIAYGLSPMVEQTRKLFIQLPNLLDPFISFAGGYIQADQLRQTLVEQFSKASGDVLGVTGRIFTNALFIFAILVFTFYFLVDWENLKKKFIKLFNKKAQKKVSGLISEVETALGSWLRAQAVLGTIIGVMTYVGLTALGVSYALPLAVIAGIMEVIPMLGPTISLIPAAIVGFGTNVWLGLWVVLLYIAVQQLENNLIVPKVMQKAVGFNPLVTLMALLIGGKLMGVIGAILAVPVTIVLSIIVKDMLSWDGD